MFQAWPKQKTNEDEPNNWQTPQSQGSPTEILQTGPKKEIGEEYAVN
jgi:hypothetical protein